MAQLVLESGEYLKPWFVSFPCGYVLGAHCTLCHIDETCMHIELLLYSVNKVKVSEGMLDSSTSSTHQIDTIDLTDAEQQVDRPLRLYVCGICGDQFVDKEDFKEHCTVMHQLVPAEPQTVRRKRKNRDDNSAFVCASNSQIQIVNAESLGMYQHDSDVSVAPPEFVDVEHLLCDESMQYGPIVILNQDDIIADDDDDGTSVNVEPSSELIVIEDD